ncbi:unnamed protein product [Adineta ricciae]|uniref:G-protein coupled receptors family 1 profile domain-containing protein n=1 Tax=Adineta ricciae TaxID=249248 RepID=A0A815MPN5_ADIRI|nr:unnamed protein product [Adineta ricciae]CAF1425853.1 unnamed protein product [Adineta ricciae]
MLNMEEAYTVAHLLMIIAGLIMLIFGSIGNLLNIYVFTLWSRSRRTLKDHHQDTHQANNSSLYLLASSISNLIVLLYPLVTRIIFDGFNYSVSQNQVIFLCKIRFFVLHTSDLMSLTYFCMATFDRYLITSRNAHLRNLSTTKHRTIQIILLVFLFFCLHNIPLLIFFEVSSTGDCDVNSNQYSYYYLYATQIFLHGIFPIVFLSIFGTLTFQQLKQLQVHVQNHLNVDKQLSRMLVLMSIAIVISSIPYCVEQLYYEMFAHGNQQQSGLIFLLHVISSILFYVNPVSSFYIYFISTPHLRHEVQRLFYRSKHHHRFTNNQIHTITDLHQSH